MSAVMLARDREVGMQAPEAVTRGLLDPPEPLAGPLTLAAHLGFGAALGAGYALLPRRGPALVRAVGLSLAVYGLSYQGWVPALGILPPATRDRQARRSTMVAAHVVFGVALAAAEGRLRESTSR